MRSALILALTLVFVGCSVEATENAPVVQTADPSRIAGKVLETFDVASYTYVRFQTAEGEEWAAVPQTSLEVGSEVVIANAQAMSNFESKTLGRSFDTIYFGTLEGGNDSSPHGSMQGGMGMARSNSAPDANAAPVKVTKAEGANGRTIAGLFAEKNGLAGKTVALRGKVVKYSENIMGRNWIHLQDGTGDATAGNNDITVTSSDSTAVGEIVLVEGIVVVDKDFGAGYRYDVIVENASVK